MRKLPSLLMLFILGLVACHEDASDDDSGIITNADFRYCACCGGYFIKIKAETYRFESAEIPTGHNQINFNNADLKFPINVKVKWKPKATRCLGDEIIVTDLRLK
jgi:hypothetical protein